MHTQKIRYPAGQVTAIGYLTYEGATTEKRPAVLIAHAFRGQDKFARKKAEEIARLGYVAFAVDLYGEGLEAENNERAGALMAPLFVNREELRARIQAGLNALLQLSFVDEKRVGAIGFCFGGLTVLELFRSGAPIVATVCFHAVLGDSLGSMKANPLPLAQAISGSILILHGNDDPLVSHHDIIGLQREFTNAKVDWQMHIYGNTQHAFTNPEARDISMGLIYHALSEKRSWQAMCDFFKEKFEV